MKSWNLTNLLSTSSMTISGCTLSGGVFTFPATVFCMINQNLPTPVVGHKYYGRVDQLVPPNTSFADGRFEYYRTDAGGTGNVVFASFFDAAQDNQWHSYSSIQQFTGLYDTSGYILRSFVVSGTNTVYRRNHLIIDLTEAFGAGNEPSKDWCDRVIPFFEGTRTIEEKPLVGVGGIARPISSGYVGVGGISRRIVAGYVGVNGASKNIFSSGIGVYKKYTVTHEWEVHTIGAFHGSNFATDFIYTNGYPPFTTISETKPKFNFTNGIISQSLENGWNERCWAAFKIDGGTYPYALKADGLSGYHDYFVIITSASKSFLQVWSWDGYVNELVKKGDVKGTYIETLYAPEGVYPSNGVKGDYWYEKVAHFDEDVALNKGNLIPLTGWLTSNYLEVPEGCTNITIETGLASGDHDCLCEYDSNRGYLSYWGAGANPRTFNFDYPNAIKYIRVTFLSSALGNCYVYDNTHGQYILKGANV